jgi:hypothetical protein
MVPGSRLAARTLRSSMTTGTNAAGTEADARDVAQGFHGAGGLSAAVFMVVWSGTLRRVQQGRWFCTGTRTVTVSVDMVRNSSEHPWQRANEAHAVRVPHCTTLDLRNWGTYGPMGTLMSPWLAG